MNASGNCVICGSQATNTPDYDKNRVFFTCPVCGRFELGATDLTHPMNYNLLAPYLLYNRFEQQWGVEYGSGHTRAPYQPDYKCLAEHIAKAFSNKMEQHPACMFFNQDVIVFILLKGFPTLLSHALTFPDSTLHPANSVIS